MLLAPILSGRKEDMFPFMLFLNTLLWGVEDTKFVLDWMEQLNKEPLQLLITFDLPDTHPVPAFIQELYTTVKNKPATRKPLSRSKWDSIFRKMLR